MKWLKKAVNGICLSPHELPLEERAAVLKVYRIAQKHIVASKSLCKYAAMRIFLIYARMIGGIECDAALQYVKEHLPGRCSGDVEGDEECAIARYLATGRATKYMILLARHWNIYGEIARFLLGGTFPRDCAGELRRLIDAMPKSHRVMLNIP
ncbi:MAG: hypothetical protein QXI07_11395 [Pyrobaculum sp.]